MVHSGFGNDIARMAGADETAVRQNLEAELFAVLPTPPPAKPAEQAS